VEDVLNVKVVIPRQVDKATVLLQHLVLSVENCSARQGLNTFI